MPTPVYCLRIPHPHTHTPWIPLLLPPFDALRALCLIMHCSPIYLRPAQQSGVCSRSSRSSSLVFAHHCNSADPSICTLHTRWCSCTPSPIQFTRQQAHVIDLMLDCSRFGRVCLFSLPHACAGTKRGATAHYPSTPCVTLLYPGSALYAVRMWKGYRNAKCALLQVAGRIVLLIYATRRGLLEVYTHAHPLGTSPAYHLLSQLDAVRALP